MKFVMLGVLASVAILGLMKMDKADMGALLVGKPQPVSFLIGRWDEVPELTEEQDSWLHRNKHGYIRFYDDGLFRSEFNGKRMEGAYQCLSGHVIEFTITWEFFDRRTGKKKNEKDETWESKYSYEDGTLKLYFKDYTALLKKAT